MWIDPDEEGEAPPTDFLLEPDYGQEERPLQEPSTCAFDPANGCLQLAFHPDSCVGDIQPGFERGDDESTVVDETRARDRGSWLEDEAKRMSTPRGPQIAPFAESPIPSPLPTPTDSQLDRMPLKTRPLQKEKALVSGCSPAQSVHSSI